MLRPATFMRPLQRLLRLSLLPLLLALLPLHGWAGTGTPAAGGTAAQVAAAMDAIEAIEAVLAAPGAGGASTMPNPAEDGDAPGHTHLVEAGEAAPSGADLAEQLLLPAAPAMADGSGRTGPPAYAALRLPEPHLPLLPRPPRG